MIICEDCKEIVEFVKRRATDGLMVCSKCNPIVTCSTCWSEITMDSDKIGDRCVECYGG